MSGTGPALALTVIKKKSADPAPNNDLLFMADSDYGLLPLWAIRRWS
jgi:hypothetical protein